MKKKNLPLIPSVTITGIGAEGKAIARIPMPNGGVPANNVKRGDSGEGSTSDIVCFVPYCVPGDVVDLQVTKKKHSFMEVRRMQVADPALRRAAALQAAAGGG